MRVNGLNRHNQEDELVDDVQQQPDIVHPIYKSKWFLMSKSFSFLPKDLLLYQKLLSKAMKVLDTSCKAAARCQIEIL